jgi:hypothetical protein
MVLLIFAAFFVLTTQVGAFARGSHLLVHGFTRIEAYLWNYCIALRSLRPFRTHAPTLAQTSCTRKKEVGGTHVVKSSVPSTVAIVLNLNITNDQSRSIMEEVGLTPLKDSAKRGEALELEKTALYPQGWKLWLLTTG